MRIIKLKNLAFSDSGRFKTGFTYEKSVETGETMTLTLSSPLEPGGPNATTGSFTFLRPSSPFLRGGGSRDLSALPAARYNKV